MTRDERRAPLLIPESPLNVLPALAAEIGLNEAIFLQQIHYWSLKVDAEGWVYNTQAEWLEQFPWLTERTLRRVIERLREQDLLETCQPERFNRRMHYRVAYEKLAARSGQPDPFSNGRSGRFSNNNTETSQETTSGSDKKTVQKVNRKAVTDTELTLVAAVVSSFNEIAGTRFSVDAHLTPIVGRIRERPELNGNHHRQVIEAVFAGEHWWNGPPAPEIVYGNARIFEKSIELARAAARRPKTPSPADFVNAEAARIRKAQGLA